MYGVMGLINKLTTNAIHEEYIIEKIPMTVYDLFSLIILIIAYV